MLTTLKDIVQEISQIPLLDEALACVATRLTEAMKVDCCTIYLADYENKQFMLVATEGLAEDAVGNVALGFSEGLVGLIGQREEPINIPDAQAHPRFKHYPEVREESYHAFLGTPIIHQRKVLGVITVQQKQRRRFGEEEEALLVTLAAQMALEVAHAEARGALKLKDTTKQSIINKSLHGVPGSPGLAIAPAFVPALKTRLRDYLLVRSTQKANEIKQYRNAVKATKKDIEELTGRIQNSVPADVLSIFQLYDHLLDANSLGHEVESKISSGWSAASALKMVVENYRDQFLQMSDPYMRERAIDVEDLGDRVFTHLIKEDVDQTAPEDPFILVAEEVTASMLAEFPEALLKGIVSMQGSVNSHASILARAMGIPAVMGLSDVPLPMLNNKMLMMDGYSGEITVEASEPARIEFEKLVEEEQELYHRVAEYADRDAQTKDGSDIELLVNAGLSVDSESVQEMPGDGVGLYRTEIPFMQKERFPSEQEQVDIYRSLFKANINKTVTMRTLDVGGDKPLSYLPFSEENPFLGWRGIRLTLDHPEIFLVQVRAMLRASIGFKTLQIMLPMVTSIQEVTEAKRLIRQAYYEVSEEAAHNNESLTKPKIGVMLEVPAILYQLPQLAEKVDFFSVGSNDLTQYILAVDRNNARVSELYNSCHPAVIKALWQIAKEASALSKPVTVCGEMAADPGGILLLLAMGYRRLSVNGHNMAKVKWVTRNASVIDCEQLLEDVVAMEDATEVLERLNLELEGLGLGGLIRAGK